ncbi:MAG: rhomboid family intramembrane serine protease [Candidatus Caldatribacteriota bacterium]|nr:rhomboid family intramembrane serine protease [Atribacterota bacterium]MDD3031731.1 rhomboid family intramembrane serine protease [Atribacterota bacterium]MDD3640665.1 rhomboid family intramembrane serine protease [Atribacterota bacterium]MDD4287977.1 rhomboid family intramembrane serine protease [Atribacterota bacterium]MDD4764538.1 rhomboid family intramembrane serine protease [Atribacterota bacterium]
MFPLWDEMPTKRIPVITIILIIINSLVYYYQFFIVTDSIRFIYSFGLTPFEISQGVDIIPYGPSPIYLTIVSSMFMHGSFVHLFGNMLYLWIFGNNIEDYLGKIKFTIFYFLSGIFAAFTQILISPQSQVPMIGASGAVAGVLGAYFILFPKSRITTLIFFGFFIRLIKMPALFVLGIWIIFQLLYGFSNISLQGADAGVAWFAHIGGFIGGIILIKLIKPVRRDYYI